VLGKLGEELGECVSAVCRSIIQGFREFHPVTKKPNKLWLEEELADVYASADLTIEELKLDTNHIMERAKAKKAYLKEWLKEAQDD
jgi:NTP pyrophosphatase (non-canonical NTP hydrolase)